MTLRTYQQVALRMARFRQRATARREQSRIVLALAEIEEAKQRDPALALALLQRAAKHQEDYEFDKALPVTPATVEPAPKPAAQDEAAEALLESTPAPEAVKEQRKREAEKPK